MNFTCNYCHKTHNQSYLASVNEYQTEQLFTEKKALEEELAQLEAEQMLTTNSKTNLKVSQLIKQLEILYSREIIGKEHVCKSCFNKFKVKVNKPFTCDICNLENKGQKFEGHVNNYQ